MINTRNFIATAVLSLCAFTGFAQQKKIIGTDKLKKYVTYFNTIDTEAVKNYVPNAEAFT